MVEVIVSEHDVPGTASEAMTASSWAMLRTVAASTTSVVRLQQHLRRRPLQENGEGVVDDETVAGLAGRSPVQCQDYRCSCRASRVVDVNGAVIENRVPWTTVTTGREDGRAPRPCAVDGKFETEAADVGLVGRRTTQNTSKIVLRSARGMPGPVSVSSITTSLPRRVASGSVSPRWCTARHRRAGSVEFAT